MDQLLDKDVPKILFKHLTNPMKAFTQNAQHLEPNSALCKVFANENFYIVRFDISHNLIFLLMSHNLAIFFFYVVRFDVSHYIIFLLMAHIYFYFLPLMAYKFTKLDWLLLADVVLRAPC